MNQTKGRRKIPFTTFQEINKRIENKTIILFGAGNIAEKTARVFSEKKIEAIVDNAKNLWGESQLDTVIHSPEYLTKAKNFYIVICTTSFVEVSQQLKQFGFKSEKDFCVSPILNDLRIIDELETINQKLLFSSGSPKQESSEYGGGIYELEVCGDTWLHKKVISGNCYGMIKYGNNYISVDQELGIFEFDREYNIVRSKEMPHGMRPHGIDYSEKHKKFFVVGSYLDSVLSLDKNFDILDTYSVSHKYERTGKPHHHCNDCCVVGDSLFVSMFSLSGNWKLDVFDGVVLEFDILTKEKFSPVIQNLWMPHNIDYIDGSLHVLDSLPGQLKTNNARVIGDFPAFTRGLAYDGVYYYIGQSRNRNYSRNMGVSNNVSIDAGIVVFDPQTKASRLLQLPPKVSEIHSLLLIP